MFDRVKFLISAHVSGVVATTVTSLHCCCKVDREVFAADDFVRFAVVKMNCRRMSSVCSGQRPRPLWVNIVGQCAMVNVRLFSVRRWRTEWCSDVDGGHSRQAHFTRHRLSSISKHACGHTHTHTRNGDRENERSEVSRAPNVISWSILDESPDNVLAVRWRSKRLDVLYCVNRRIPLSSFRFFDDALMKYTLVQNIA